MAVEILSGLRNGRIVTFAFNDLRRFADVVFAID
jgi:hypothetical protein